MTDKETRKNSATDILRRLSERVNPPESELGGLDTGFRHSNYYHKYFQGYTEIRIEKPNGGYKIERRYTAPWIQHDLSEKAVVLTKVGYVLATVVSIMLFLWAGMQEAISNYCKFVALPGVLTAFSLLLTVAGICSYVIAPHKMTIYQHQSSTQRAFLFPLISAIGMLLTALMKGVFLYLNPVCFQPGEVYSLVAVLLAAALLFGLSRTEHNMHYKRVENENEVLEEERYQIW